MAHRNKNLPDEQKLSICRQNFATASLVVYAQKNSVFLEEINEKIEVFASAGLTEMWVEKFVSKNTKKPAENEPKALNFGQVKACFVTLVIGSLTSLIAFVVEAVRRKW
jgi:hypothetical protein